MTTDPHRLLVALAATKPSSLVVRWGHHVRLPGAGSLAFTIDVDPTKLDASDNEFLISILRGITEHAELSA